MPNTMLLTSAHAETHVVATPLDAIMKLEGEEIDLVVLAGQHARDSGLASFLAEFYPSVRIVREP
jgi:hypothetical protein